MRVKLNRGPAKGKVQEFSNPGTLIIWAQSRVVDWLTMDPSAEIPRHEGEYRRSNVTLKNGTVVYEWMGWRN